MFSAKKKVMLYVDPYSFLATLWCVLCVDVWNVVCRLFGTTMIAQLRNLQISNYCFKGIGAPL